MKKMGFFLLAIIIFAVIIYVTFILAVIKIAIGAILFIAAVILLWIAWHKIKHTFD